jgi:hypothetical protein
VTWTVDEGANWGTISAGGLYTAPGTLPNPVTATVRATSVADPSRSATATVTIDDGTGTVNVSVTPPTATVLLNATQQFSAQVTGTTNTAVTWTVDEGANWGTVSAAGLYTAPGTLPSPVTATVRATSVADPGRSATATVTLSTQQIPPTEESTILQLFSGAYEVGDIGLDAVQIAAEAVFGASQLAGGTLTLHGTLTQSAPGSDVWNYSPTPADKLLVVYAGGATVEFTFNAFNGYLEGSWEDFVDAHQALDFTVVVQGAYDIHIQSTKYFTKGSPLGSPTGGSKAWDAEFARRIIGTVVYEGETLTLDITHTGQEIDCYVEPPFAHYEYDESYTGTITSASASIILNQQYWASLMHNSSTYTHVKDTVLQNNSSVNISGTTYGWNDVYVKWHAGSILHDPGYFSVVIEPHNWELRGSLLKDGAVYGVLQYDRPLVAESHGPELILHLNSGEDIWLHTLIQYP